MSRAASLHRLCLLLVGASALALPQVLHAQAAPSPYTTGYRYDLQQRLVGTIAPDPDGAGAIHYAAVRNWYDVNGRLTKVETGELAAWQDQSIAPSDWASYTTFTIFQTVDTTYDADGRKTKATLTGSDAVVKSVSQTSYDGLDRPVCAALRMDPAQWSGQSDACVPQTSGSNGPDRITKTLYDTAGHVTKIQKAYGTSLQQDYVTYTYTIGGQIASVTDANQTHADYIYNNLDRLYRWYFPSKVTANLASATDYEEYGYDPNGNRTSRRNRAGYTFSYTYDALNRNTVKLVPDNAGFVATDRTRDVYTGYDNRGLMTFARFDSTSGAGITNVFDNAGRLSSMANSLIGSGKTLSYSYDADSNRTRITHPDGAYFDMAYDGLDRQNNVTWNGSSTLMSLAYDNQGHRSSANRGNTPVTYGYDAASRLNSLADDFAGTTNDVTVTLGYNPASQINSETHSNDAYVYTNYAAVNRNYAVNGLNQYTSVGTNNYAYDANGNLTSDGGITYVYDMENRLVSATGPTATNLYYDPLGRLWTTTTSSTTTRFLYDGDNLVGEYDGSANLLKRYHFGPGTDEVVFEDDGGMNCSATKFLHADHEGSIVASTDCSANVTAINKYDEWGIPGSGNTGRFQYTGQIWMPEIGMSYYKARMYSPTLGRFMQTDPIGYKDQVNLYAYVGNDPTNRADSTGLTSEVPSSSRTSQEFGTCGSSRPDLDCRSGGVDGYGSSGSDTSSGANQLSVLTDPQSTSSVDGKKTAAIPLVIAACMVDPPCAAAVIAAGGIITKVIIDRFFPQAVLNQSKTPNTGEPGSTHTNPGSGQVRKYGPDGKPVRDIDRDHAHGGAPNPHAHDWGRLPDGTPHRGPPRPLTPEEEQEVEEE